MNVDVDHYVTNTSCSFWFRYIYDICKICNLHEQTVNKLQQELI